MKRILLIDDSPDYRDASSVILGDAGYDFFEAPSPKDAFELLANESFDLILCDLHMPLTADDHQAEFVYSFEVGVRVVQELSRLFPNVPLAVLSTIERCDLKRLSPFLGEVPAFTKPFRHTELLSLVKELCDPALRVIQ